MRQTGRVLRLGDNIDTDAILPARYMVLTDPKELGEHCMEGLDPEWIKQVRPGDIIAAGRNFGCGSSREHAPIAILGAGIKIVIAASFARIFYRSGINLGLLLLEVGSAADFILPEHRLSIDTREGVIENVTNRTTCRFQPLPPALQAIADCGGLEAYVRKRLQNENAGRRAGA